MHKGNTYVVTVSIINHHLLNILLGPVLGILYVGLHPPTRQALSPLFYKWEVQGDRVTASETKSVWLQSPGPAPSPPPPRPKSQQHRHYYPSYSDEQNEAQEEVNCQLMRALKHWNQDLLLFRPLN